MLKVKDVSKTYGNNRVLSNISFVVEDGHKIALTGFNGVGKTTLLKIIAGEEECDKGKIEINKGVKLAFLPQDPKEYSDVKVLEYILSKLDNVDHIVHRDIDVMFAGFGLDGEIKEKNIGELSSGQKTKIFLVAILLQHADILILDEPTNNLDLPSLIWLEEYLSNTKSAIIVVSHDAVFLDRVCNKVMEIDWKSHKVEIKNGKYSDYLLQQKKDTDRQAKKHKLQKEDLKRLWNLATEKKIKAAKGMKMQTNDNDKIARGYHRNRASNSLRDAQVIQGRIGRMERIEKPDYRRSFNILIDPVDDGSSRDIMISNLICGYDDGFRVGPINIAIPFGSRIGILGLNGKGKSTILRTIVGDIEKIEGTLSIGNGVVFGNLMQEHQSLDRGKNVLKYAVKNFKGEKEEVYNTLQHFGFDIDKLDIDIGELSPGGRARLLLAMFAVNKVNVLVLDEPTNHLDREAQEALNTTLSKFEGTVIMVTHDRKFVEKFDNSVIYVLEDSVLDKLGNFNTYLEKMTEKSKKLVRMLGR